MAGSACVTVEVSKSCAGDDVSADTLNETRSETLMEKITTSSMMLFLVPLWSK